MKTRNLAVKVAQIGLHVVGSSEKTFFWKSKKCCSQMLANDLKIVFNF